MMRTAAVVLLGTLAGCGGDALTGAHGGAAGTDESDCITSLDCGAHEACRDGACVPVDPPDDSPDDPLTDDPPDDPPAPGRPLWVGGQWQTEYHLDWSDYLGPLADLGPEIDALDQLLLGTSDIGDLPIAGPIIEDLIDRYVPSWVGDLVHVLNGIIHFFRDVKIEGTMSLAQVPGAPRSLEGSELWVRGMVSIIDRCPLGASDPSYPDCAYVPVPLNQIIAGFGVISATAEPFTGSFVGDEVRFADREVEMEISQFVLFLIDRIVRFATGGDHDSLEDALTDLIDCAGFAVAVEDLLCASLDLCSPMPFVEDACVGARDEVVAEVTDALLGITVDWEVMRFDQRALAVDELADGAADKLCDPPARPG